MTWKVLVNIRNLVNMYCLNGHFPPLPAHEDRAQGRQANVQTRLASPSHAKSTGGFD